MKFIKILLGILLFIFQIVFLYLPVELKILYNTRLGFMRQILFMNETYPIHWLAYIFWGLILLSISTFILNGFRMYALHQTSGWFSISWMLVLTLLVATLDVSFNYGGDPLYFYNLACFCVVLLSQLILIQVMNFKPRY